MAALRFAAATVTTAVVMTHSASAEAICPDATSPMMSTVTGIAPECFRKCPQMCAPMDSIITKYMESMDTSVIKPLICADKTPFTCLYGEDSKQDCKVLLDAGSGFGITIPRNVNQLNSECVEDGAGNNGQRHADIDSQSGNETNGTNETNSTENATTTVSASAISDGAGRRGLTFSAVFATAAATAVAWLSFA